MGPLAAHLKRGLNSIRPLLIETWADPRTMSNLSIKLSDCLLFVMRKARTRFLTDEWISRCPCIGKRIVFQCRIYRIYSLGWRRKSLLLRLLFLLTDCLASVADCSAFLAASLVLASSTLAYLRSLFSCSTLDLAASTSSSLSPSCCWDPSNACWELAALPEGN